MLRTALVITLCLLSPLAFAGDEEDPAVALAQSVADQASALEDEGEWRSASWQWMKAWETNGVENEYGLRSGLAALEASDCARAKRVLNRYLDAESDDKRGQRKAQEALDELAKRGCANPDEEQATEQAKALYVWAEERAEGGQWEDAMYAYEDAYFLVPAKVGFAFKVGKAAFEARRCEKAGEYLDHFSRYGDPEKHADMLTEADGMQNRLETLGCGQSEAPPPVGKKGCALSDDDSPIAPLFVLVPLLYRRPERERTL